MGGDNSPMNLTPPISVELHAALHKDLYEQLGHTEDFMAWKGLSSESLKGIGNFNLGRKRSEKTRKKMSEAAKRRYKNPKEREKLSLAHLGKKHSKEHTEKSATAQRGQKRSEETKRRISLGMLGNRNSVRKSNPQHA